jgi:hypothetical protein
MSEEVPYLSDEDLAIISDLFEDDLDKAHGAHILHMWQEGEKHHKEQTRSLLDAIAQARMAQESDQQ